MYRFKNDYNFIAHENVLNAMIKYQDEACEGYGLDIHSLNAKELIKKHIHGVDVDIHFLVGGTSANKIVIAHSLRPYESVISATTGHINVHETGAIEVTGHKIVSIGHVDGKISVKDIEECVKFHTDEHMIIPKMVYISESTELGTLYTKEEIKEIYECCKKHGLYLFVDGARLGTALAKGVVTIDDLAHYTDAFYIGGTKNGAMLGEAVVIVNDKLKENFRFSIKQNGGMYAKGYVAGIQFEELFKDNLYFELAKNSNDCASYFASELVKRGIALYQECVTNQIFVVVSNELCDAMLKIADFNIWEELGESKVIRLVCNFKTTKADIDAFLVELDKLLKQ